MGPRSHRPDKIARASPLQWHFRLAMIAFNIQSMVGGGPIGHTGLENSMTHMNPSCSPSPTPQKHPWRQLEFFPFLSPFNSAAVSHFIHKLSNSLMTIMWRHYQTYLNISSRRLHFAAAVTNSCFRFCFVLFWEGILINNLASRVASFYFNW